jgi:hypothetical protein
MKDPREHRTADGEDSKKGGWSPKQRFRLRKDVYVRYAGRVDVVKFVRACKVVSRSPARVLKYASSVCCCMRDLND